jgi:hypothetical protein
LLLLPHDQSEKSFSSEWRSWIFLAQIVEERERTVSSGFSERGLAPERSESAKRWKAQQREWWRRGSDDRDWWEKKRVAKRWAVYARAAKRQRQS